MPCTPMPSSQRNLEASPEEFLPAAFRRAGLELPFTLLCWEVLSELHLPSTYQCWVLKALEGRPWCLVSQEQAAASPSPPFPTK